MEETITKEITVDENGVVNEVTTKKKELSEKGKELLERMTIEMNIMDMHKRTLEELKAEFEAITK